MAFLLSLLFSLTCFAKLEKLIVDQGTLTYTKPMGSGEVEKIQLGLSKNSSMGPYPIEISRGEQSLDVKSEFIDFSWEKPMALFHNMDKFYIQKANIALASKAHYVISPKLIMQPDNSGEFSLDDLAISCAGVAEGGRIEDRILDDCIEHLQARVLRLQIPTSSFLAEMMKDLPEVEPEINVPAWDFDMLMNKGTFKLDFRVRYYINAGIYAWGHMQLEDDRQTLAIRLDKVKYGILGVTALVFKKLKTLEGPNVKVEQPWIRIKIKNATNTR